MVLTRESTSRFNSRTLLPDVGIYLAPRLNHPFAVNRRLVTILVPALPHDSYRSSVALISRHPPLFHIAS